MDDPRQARHVFEALVLTALADGDPRYEEAERIDRLLVMHPAFAGLEGADQIGIEMWERLRRDGMEACLEQVARGLPDRAYQELAFQLCAKVMGADGESGGEEAMML